MPRALPVSFYLLLFFGLLIGNIAIYRTIFAPRVLQMAVLEVGKGDATLVRTQNGKTILVDTGPDASILRALGAALPPWQRRIDAVVLTGTKKASVGGLPEVESRYRVSTITRVGGADVPYGTSLSFDDSRIEIVSPSTLNISYDTSSLFISSSTPKGVYISNGKTVTKTR